MTNDEARSSKDLPTKEDRSEVLRALEEALLEMRAGDSGVSLDDFDRSFRERNGLGLG